MAPLSQRKRKGILLGQEGNALVALIVINAVVFVIVNFIKIGYFLSNMEEAAFYKNVLAWLLVPAQVDVLLSRPWALFTFMFTNVGVWQLISNMLWFWAFAYILQDLTGNRHLAPIYIYGGWMGAFMFVLVNNLFPVLANQLPSIAPLGGAGASVMAIAVAATALAPGYRIFPMLHGGIPLWIVTLIFVLIDYALIASVGAGTAVAHLSGGFIGLMYIKAVQRGGDWGEWMHQLYNWFLHLFDPKKPTPEQTRQRMHYKAGPEPFKATPHLTQQRVDELLDKINKKGYHFLTDEEKEYLKRASKEEL